MTVLALVYTYRDSHNAQRYGEWDGEPAVAAEAAANALKARCEGSVWVYFDDADRQHHAVTAEQLALLGAALLSGHSMASAYSLWCQSI